MEDDDDGQQQQQQLIFTAKYLILISGVIFWPSYEKHA